MNEIVIDDPGDLGEAIRAGRKKQELTQEEFAMVADVGTRFLSELERGKQTAELGLSLRAVKLAGYEVVLRPRGWHSAREPGSTS